MSAGAAPPSEIISLPKGGGAMHGLGEKFRPDLHTGTGNFTIPISVPPGRGGFQPQLSLNYSTGSGNGLFGQGWSLDLPGVARKTSKGRPRYEDAHRDPGKRDVFVLSGAEDLVALDEPPAAVTRYRPRTEGLFARIERHREADNDYWIVHSREGLESFYGTPRPARAAATWSDPAVLAGPKRIPTETPRIFRWHLTLTTDPFGNRIEYLYDERDRSTPAEIGGGHEPRDQPLLSRIRYVDYETNGATRFLVTVTFEYEARSDAFSDYRAAFEQRTTRRCRAILVETHADRDRKVRRYEFDYSNAALNGVSQLVAIRLLGYDDTGAAAQALPPLEFRYTAFEPQDARRRRFLPISGRELPSSSLADPSLELVDLFGSGLPDILQLDGVPRYWRNLGRGRFAKPRTMAQAPEGFGLADAGVQIVDADGDGRADLLITQPEVSGYFPLEFGARWDRRSFRKYATVPSVDLKSPDVRLVDLTGDGVTDVIRSGTSLECFFNDREKGWTEMRQVARRGPPDFPDVDFADEHVKLADMSGDGLQDIVHVHDGGVDYWPNLGYGDWGRRLHMRNSPRLPYQYDPARILLGDVDGDGLADLVYVDDRKIYLWINRSGNAWSDAIVIEGATPVADMDAVRLTDLLGSGVAGILWSGDALPAGRDHAFFLDLTGGTKPYLLQEMDNNMGARTRVGYASSVEFYLADEGAPKTRWKTTLPFPVAVVAGVEIIDEVSGGKLTTEYRYHHGYWDGGEREFRGFGLVEQFDSESFEDYARHGLHGAATVFAAVDRKYFSAPTCTRTWFHIGPVGEEVGDWHELDWSDQFWPGDAPLLGHVESVDAFLRTLPDRRARRDALRALRGSVLRTELYGRDGSDREDRPYTVTEYTYALREEAAPGAGSDRRRIFFPHLVAERTTQWERGDDPMTTISYAHEYDAFGNPLTQVQIACPRGWRRMDDAVPQASYLATLTRTQIAVPRDADVYIHDRAARIARYEILNPPTAAGRTLPQVLGLLLSPASLRLFAESLNFYDGDPAIADRLAFQGLPFGVVGRYGAVTRSEDLVLTEEIVAAAYGASSPPYLTPGQALAASADYPAGFVRQLPPAAGYVFHAAGGPAPYAGGYYVRSRSRRFDFHGAGRVRGLVLAERDPLGAETLIAYDRPYDALPASITDAARLSTRAEYDYRVMQPRLLTDANDNRTRIDFAPIGLVSAVWLTGKQDQGEGDVGRPSTTFEYNFRAFLDGKLVDPNRAEPIFVRIVRRTHHDSDADDRGETVEARGYSDGFGRLLQTRTQGEVVRFGDAVFGGGESVLPASQDEGGGGEVRGAATVGTVVVSGAQRFDNKGRAVEKYEPFFSTGWSYAPPRDAIDPVDRDYGARVEMFYDPRGRLIRTVNADGSEERVVHGVPVDLDDPTDPDRITPTAWETYTYDANDNAGRTHPRASTGYGHHWNTPSSLVVDALGRTVLSVVRNRARPARVTDPPPPIEEHRTRYRYDIQGNLLALIDPLNRTAFAYVYDLARHPLRTSSIDAGERIVVLDAAGREIERRDSKGARVLRSYDVLDRPAGVWARNVSGESMTLRERSQYGDGGDPDQPPNARAAARAANVLGRPSRQLDEAGELRFDAYDFKGNLLEKTRSVVGDAPLIAALDAAGGPARRFVADWDDPPALEGDYTISTTYDALNRVKRLQYPRDVDGARKILAPSYNRAGSLERVALGGDVFVERIAYNAKGQRVLIAYGNAVMTRYAYDPQTFRLARMRTERFTSPAAAAYRPRGQPLQDLAYRYDLAGNVVTLTERTPGCGVRNNAEAPLFPDLAALLTTGDALVRRFEYDPLYRLLSATGREADNIPPGGRPFEDTARDGFGWGGPGTPTPSAARDSTRIYTEAYEYDAADNMLAVRHGAWTRDFGVGGRTPRNWAQEWRLHLDPAAPWQVVPSNRLTHVGNGQPGAAQTHFFDDNGNLVRENTERHFAWDAADRLVAFANRPSGGNATVEACYLYDSSGRRVKKLVRRGAVVEVTVYVDGVFEHHVAGTGQDNTLHVIDDRTRVALIRVKTPLPNDPEPIVQYQLGDHLESAHIVVGGADASADGFVNREEFFPYGETSFGSFGRKRYRFTGQERDEESGLNYHGARYYALHLARWTGADPVSPAYGINAYVYCHDSPGERRDADGLSDKEPDVDAVDPEREWEFPASLGASPSSGATGSRSDVPATSAPPLVPSPSDPPLEEISWSAETGRPHAEPLFAGEIPTGKPGEVFVESWTSPREEARERALLPESVRESLPEPKGYYTTLRAHSIEPESGGTPPSAPARTGETPDDQDTLPPVFEQQDPGEPSHPGERSLILGPPNADYIGLPVLAALAAVVGVIVLVAAVPAGALAGSALIGVAALLTGIFVLTGLTLERASEEQ